MTSDGAATDERARSSRLVVVTGGAGFIGATLVRTLEARGDRVRVVDSGVTAGFGALDGTRAEIVRADISDALAALDGADAVVHLAARTSVPASIEDPMADFAINVVASVRLLDAARTAGVGRFVLGSSMAAVGAAEPPLRATTLPRPIAPYGAAKLAAEAYLHAYAASYGMVTVSLRCSNVYGPFSSHKRSVVHGFIRRLLAGEPLVVHGDGGQTRDFVHVSDVCAAFVASLDLPGEPLAGQVVPVGSGVETSITGLIESLFTAAGSRVPVEHLPARAGNVPRSVLDVSTAQALLGWEPRMSLADGLRDTLAWYRSTRPDAA